MNVGKKIRQLEVRTGDFVAAFLAAIYKKQNKQEEEIQLVHTSEGK